MPDSASPSAGADVRSLQPVRVGSRVYLRAHGPEDLARMREIWRDPVAMRFVPVAPRTEEEVAAAFDALLRPDPFARRSHRFAIVRRHDDVLAGTIAIDFERFSSAFTHSMVLHRDCWGRGIASEAYDLLLAFAFEDHGVHRVWGAVATDNDAAQRWIKRVGLTRCGTINEFFRGDDGRTMDIDIYSCLDREWRAHAHRASG
jgi:RimJ/RimL family protein N-acetyltransferase